MLGRLEITLELQSIDTKSRLQYTSYGLNIYVHYYSITAIKVLQHQFPCSFTMYIHTLSYRPFDALFFDVTRIANILFAVVSLLQCYTYNVHYFV